MFTEQKLKAGTALCDGVMKQIGFNGSVSGHDDSEIQHDQGDIQESYLTLTKHPSFLQGMPEPDIEYIPVLWISAIPAGMTMIC